jgi:D-alanine-D-alanine ligase-like ATP-grasp enzyme
VRIAVVFDTLHPDWEDADYQKEVDADVAEAEYDVARALRARGHEALLVGVGAELGLMLQRLARCQPQLLFNGCEAFRGQARHEYAVAAVLEMHGYRYTGSSPTALLVARDKALTKQILTYHGIRVPAFAAFPPGAATVRPSELRFPLIVKPLLEDASVGKTIKTVFAKDLPQEVTAKIAATCSTAFHALGLRDYGRVDLRLTHDDEVYVLEVNPNPFLARENEMADAAAQAGMSYPEFIQRIVDAALARDPA